MRHVQVYDHIAYKIAQKRGLIFMMYNIESFFSPIYLVARCEVGVDNKSIWIWAHWPVETSKLVLYFRLVLFFSVLFGLEEINVHSIIIILFFVLFIFCYTFDKYFAQINLLWREQVNPVLTLLDIPHILSLYARAILHT